MPDVKAKTKSRPLLIVLLDFLVETVQDPARHAHISDSHCVANPLRGFTQCDQARLPFDRLRVPKEVGMRIGLHDLVYDWHDISVGMLDGVKPHLPVALDQPGQVRGNKLAEAVRAEERTGIQAAVCYYASGGLGSKFSQPACLLKAAGSGPVTLTVAN